MPKLWSDTIEAHRRAVHAAIMDTAWRLAAENGLTSVSMSQVAKEAGVGRATLYKYFANVEAILIAWHQRHAAGHLDQLRTLSEGSGDARDRLHAVVEAYALIAHQREHGSAELGALLHRGPHARAAEEQLIGLLRDLLVEVAERGQLRRDTSPEELATYCLHALNAASTLPSKAAVRRLVAVTLAGLAPPA